MVGHELSQRERDDVVTAPVCQLLDRQAAERFSRGSGREQRASLENGMRQRVVGRVHPQQSFVFAHLEIEHPNRAVSHPGVDDKKRRRIEYKKRLLLDEVCLIAVALDL